ncbi:ATP-binding cassette domain-containing protein [Actinoplanes palleronii]|uniref:ABC transporter ATP-binding protein n=1 Tax=Actinoplanes palleronii TaxID=113570 RepID=A0ABQ4BQX0_9ACTN|nr:ATP-binding cassette domain-containing protein [Actinoplanes palleronii]GIE73073.1 ABC transporter ATP-binding protein [Actinoplanes palleronii]
MNLTVERVSAGYGHVRVLDELSWRIPPGVTGLLGPNGAGKTTLLHLLAGITRPWQGAITARDGSASVLSTGKEYSRRVGFLPQHFTFAEEMRVLDTATYAAWVNGVPKRDCPAAAWAALEQVDLHSKSRDRVKSLSGGQRQRLGLATALAHEPDLLILDEPTVGLDPAQRLRLREAITSIGARRTVVISTHLIEDVTYMCDRVGVLAAGKMAFDDTIDELAKLVDEDAGHGFGSAFEQAYAGIVARLGREA